jgi:hypothetical protein
MHEIFARGATLWRILGVAYPTFVPILAQPCSALHRYKQASQHDLHCTEEKIAIESQSIMEILLILNYSYY